MTEQIQTLNGRYKLLERTGSGGMATVYKAQDLVLGRIVAVKLLHPGLTNDPAFLRSFHHEAHAAANLTHPNIVTVHDIGQDQRHHYIVMEFVEGHTLKQIIRTLSKRGQRMPVNRALDIAIQIARGIGFAHRGELVHCDLKPQNVIVTRDQRVKVADFGIARAISELNEATRSVVWGTPQYFSPEQAAGEGATPASDVYAIGVMLFEMLTNQLPFQGETPAQLAEQHLHAPPPSLKALNPAIPTQVEQIVQKVLAKEPAGRYRTAGQLERILTAYREQSAQQTTPYDPDEDWEDTGSHSRAMPPHRTGATPHGVGPRHGEVTRRGGATSRSSTTLLADESTIHVPAPPAAGSDWGAIGLGIIAVAALLGLIPLWWVVYLRWAAVLP